MIWFSFTGMEISTCSRCAIGPSILSDVSIRVSGDVVGSSESSGGSAVSVISSPEISKENDPA